MINFNAEFRLPFVIERRLAKFLFTTKVRERCWRKLASHQRHRMPLDESLKLFAKQARVNKSPVEHCYTEIRNRLAFGKNIGEALSGFASPEEVLLIHSKRRKFYRRSYLGGGTFGRQKKNHYCPRWRSDLSSYAEWNTCPVPVHHQCRCHAANGSQHRS